METTKQNSLEENIRSIVAEIGEIEPADITPEADFIEDLGLDSMMALEILAALEKKFNLRIPEENLTKMVNLKQVVELVSQFQK